MSAIEKLKEYIPGGDDSPDIRTLECQDCGHIFDTGKQPERAQCPECLARDVDVA